MAKKTFYRQDGEWREQNDLHINVPLEKIPPPILQEALRSQSSNVSGKLTVTKRIADRLISRLARKLTEAEKRVVLIQTLIDQTNGAQTRIDTFLSGEVPKLPSATVDVDENGGPIEPIPDPAVPTP